MFPLKAWQLDHSENEETDQAKEGKDALSHTDSISVRVRWRAGITTGQPGQLLYWLRLQLSGWHTHSKKEQQWVHDMAPNEQPTLPKDSANRAYNYSLFIVF